MRKIIVLSMITLDGVMQAPGGPKEDTSGGFKYGGWTASYGDKVFGKVVEKEMKPADYLLGRKTFEIFASYWPEHEDVWPGINEVTKYVRGEGGYVIMSDGTTVNVSRSRKESLLKWF